MSVASFVATPRSGPKGIAVLLALAAVVGVIVSFVAWGYLELVHQIQQGVFTDLPRELGYDDGAPLWWYLPVLALGGLLVALAIVVLPGEGGHVPAYGLNTGKTEPIELPGIVFAALATLGLGLVLGPEAPLIALGGGLGVVLIRLVRSDAPPPVVMVIAAAGAFAAVSMIFDSPLIAAILLIEATAIGGRRLPLLLVPGLLAAGIGSLVSIGMGSWTGLSTADYALGTLDLPAFARPSASDLAWTIPLAAVIAVGAVAVMGLGREVHRVVKGRLLVALPLAGLAVAGAAIAFAQTTDHGAQEVLFSGQDALPTLVTEASTWSLSALALLLAFKGLAWSISLGSFRGGPTFPAMFLGAAAGLMASHLPGFGMTPAIAVGLAAGVVGVLRLPLSAAVLATVLTETSGAGAAPLIIVGVVVAYLTTMALTRAPMPEAVGDDETEAPAPAPAQQTSPPSKVRA